MQISVDKPGSLWGTSIINKSNKALGPYTGTNNNSAFNTVVDKTKTNKLLASASRLREQGKHR